MKKITREHLKEKYGIRVSARKYHMIILASTYDDKAVFEFIREFAPKELFDFIYEGHKHTIIGRVNQTKRGYTK